MSGYFLTIIIFVFFTLNARHVTAQDLSANILRIVDSTNQYLDKAEKQIEYGKPEWARPRIKAARRQFKIISDSLGSDHPILLKINSRITKIDSVLEAATIKNETTPKNTRTTTKMELAADAFRSIKAADRQLIWVKLKGYKGAGARKALEAAKLEYEKIFNYQKGRYDPEHPQIIELKKRIDEAVQALNLKSDNKD